MNRQQNTALEAASKKPEKSSNALSQHKTWQLAAKLEPFDSYWQAPDDIEKGYTSFGAYYKYNYLPLLPADRSTKILVVSCGPGYLLNVLRDNGYVDVLGIDSDKDKISHAISRKLNCQVAAAFPFLESASDEYDVIIPEQELNHLTLDEMIDFLCLCRSNLTSDGLIVVYGLNGANPMVGSENLAHNIDHFNTFTEHSLKQILQLAGFQNIKIHPLKIYVFWKNPLNYVGLAITGFLELVLRILFRIYGKNVSILSKKIAATARN